MSHMHHLWTIYPVYRPWLLMVLDLKTCTLPTGFEFACGRDKQMVLDCLNAQWTRPRKVRCGSRICTHLKFGSRSGPRIKFSSSSSTWIFKYVIKIWHSFKFKSGMGMASGLWGYNQLDTSPDVHIHRPNIVPGLGIACTQQGMFLTQAWNLN